MKIDHSIKQTGMRPRRLAPTFFGVKGGVRLQAATDATFLGPKTWSPPIT